jgi:Tfp pilus assembly protein PilN
MSVAVASLLAALAAVVGGWWHLRADVDRWQRELQVTEARVAALAPDVQQVTVLRARTAHLDAMRDDLRVRHTRWRVVSSFLAGLGDVMPADLWLLAIEFDDTSLVMEGRGVSIEAVTTWVDHLNGRAEWPWLVSVADTGRDPGSLDVAFTLRGRPR